MYIEIAGLFRYNSIKAYETAYIVTIYSLFLTTKSLLGGVAYDNI